MALGISGRTLWDVTSRHTYHEILIDRMMIKMFSYIEGLEPRSKLPCRQRRLRWAILSQVKKLNAYMMRHLRKIMKTTWKDKVPNNKIYRRSGLAPMAEICLWSGDHKTRKVIVHPTDCLWWWWPDMRWHSAINHVTQMAHLLMSAC